MKYLFILLFTLIQASMFAQDTLKVIEEERFMSKGNQNGFSVVIPQARLKDVTSSWKKYVREKNKSDFKEVKGEYILTKTLIPAISADSVMLYTIFTEATNHINLATFITRDDVAFCSSATDKNLSEKIKAYVRTFAVGEYRKAVADELDQEQKKLKDIEENIADLEKENEKMEKKIKSNEREISTIKSNIRTNENEQDINEKGMYHQQQLISTLEKSDLKEEQEKKLKELEKAKKRLQKENKSLHEDIDELESENKSLKKKIDANEEENIPSKKKDKDKQRLIVANVQVKLKNIQ
jgi:peptidoglycan hydrolase CwlO-like protein